MTGRAEKTIQQELKTLPVGPSEIGEQWYARARLDALTLSVRLWGRGAGPRQPAAAHGGTQALPRLNGCGDPSARELHTALRHLAGCERGPRQPAAAQGGTQTLANPVH